MNTPWRFVLVLVSCMVFVVCLAYVGVHFADKPVTWMPTAFYCCAAFLVAGLAWAYHPIFSKMRSTLTRYTVQITVTILSAIVSAYLEYTLFINVWFLFGGGL
jgi:hypothetical protein